MFRYHGFSGDCPKPPLPLSETPKTEALVSEFLFEDEADVHLALKDMTELSRTLERSLARVEAGLREAVKFTRHMPVCDKWAYSSLQMDHYLTGNPCTCGLDATLSRLRQERKE